MAWQTAAVERPRSPATLRFEDVWLTFAGPHGPVDVLRGVDVTIPLTGITAIVGRSGSGKTSLLRLANRLEVPTRGRVVLDGTDVADLDPLALRRRVGMVFQHPVVFAGTVADNLAVAVPGIDEATGSAALQRCGLDASFWHRTADDLSGGEAQRLCLARTLLTNPEVLLADEPTSALDPDARHRIEELVVGLARTDGIAVLWVTHDHDQVAAVADRVLEVRAGQVRAVPDADRSPDAGEGSAG